MFQLLSLPFLSFINDGIESFLNSLQLNPSSYGYLFPPSAVDAAQIQRMVEVSFTIYKIK